MQTDQLSRRTPLKGGGASLADLSIIQVAGPPHAVSGLGGG